MVVLWSVGLFLQVGVYEGVHLNAYSECVEVEDVGNVQLCHDGVSVSSGW